MLPVHTKTLPRCLDAGNNNFTDLVGILHIRFIAIMFSFTCYMDGS